MSTLVVNEIPTSGSALQWAFTVDRDTKVKHVRLHLYRHLHPAGTLSLSILNRQGHTIITSGAVTIDSIPTASPADYFHGWVRFDLDIHLKASTNYFFYITSNGYTLGASFAGIVCTTDQGAYPVTTGMGYDFEVWGLKDLSRGTV